MCTFLASETIQYYRNGGNNVYAVLLDCSKAFDVIRYDELFQALIDRKMCPIIVRLILNLYTSVKYCVRWNGEVSRKFRISNGVKQGGVMSPFLFTVVMESLIEKVKSLNIGCHIGNKNASIFVFADDILLLCPTRASAQKLVDTCYNHAEILGLTFNTDKCKFIIFSKDVLHDVTLNMGGDILKRIDEEYHIGHILSNGAH